MLINLLRLHPYAVIPKQSTELAGGWDVVATEVISESKDFVIYKIGWAMQPPEGYKITLVPRSSLTKTKWVLQNSPGLGDADYRGEYQYKFRAIPNDIKHSVIPYLDYEPKPFLVGDRIGQIYLEEVIPIEFEEVSELPSTNRGTGGFGSTGK
jgi:dUTP pyrophosphatase